MKTANILTQNLSIVALCRAITSITAQHFPKPLFTIFNFCRATSSYNGQYLQFPKDVALQSEIVHNNI